MAVIDDVRRLMQLDFMFLGVNYFTPSNPDAAAAQPCGTREGSSRPMMDLSSSAPSAKTARWLVFNSGRLLAIGTLLRPWQAASTSKFL